MWGLLLVAKKPTRAATHCRAALAGIGCPAPLPSRWAYTVTGTLASSTSHGPYTLNCLVARISAAPEGNRNHTLYGALKDAQRQGDLDAFGPDLASAALGGRARHSGDRKMLPLLPG